MKDWERRIWTDDNLTLFVAVLCVVFIAAALTLIGWTVNLLGGFFVIRQWLHL